MKLKLKNIGKIRQADIDINGITVIAGENDTGKSTVAKALFAMCMAFDDTADQIQSDRRNSIAKEIYNFFKASLYILASPKNKDLQLIAQNIIDTGENGKESIREEFINSINNLLENNSKRFIFWDENDKNKFMDEISDELIDKIYEIISMPSDKVMEKLIEMAIRIEFNGQTRCSFNSDLGDIVLSNENRINHVMIENEQIIHAVDLNSFFPTVRPIYVDNATVFYKEDTLTIRHSALNIELAIESKENAIEALIADEKLELILKKLNEVSSGSLIRNKFGDWYYRLKDKTLALNNLSSGIKAFAVIRRLIENGELKDNGILILDEPETHLHPAWQLVFAEIIVLLRKYLNLRILLNTHSPYFLHAIEVYSAYHEIADQCVYYLADNKDGMAEFENVTGSIDKIYKKLLEPIQRLEDIEAEIND